MTFGSLFSGIGGFDLGFERSGLTCLWQVEKDEPCRKLLAAKYPHAKQFEDVCHVCAAELIRPDLICGGFPCQDLSVAGRRAGLAGERSGLFFEFMRIVGELAPEWVVVENVPGLLSSNGGRDMGTVLGFLGQLGYGTAYRVLDAQWFGVAQRRRRVFVVGCLGNWRRAAEVLFERESLPWDSPPSRRYEARYSRGAARFTDGDCHPVIAFGTKDYTQDAANDISPTLRSMMNDKADPNCGGQVSIVAGFKRGQGAKARSIGFQQEQSPTLTSSDSGTQQCPGVLVGSIVRRLMPLEAERLQGFPDDWTAGFSDSCRYRMLGNAVAVPVASWIAERIVKT